MTFKGICHLRIFAVLTLLVSNFVIAQVPTKYTEIASVVISHEYYSQSPPPFFLELIDGNDQVIARNIPGKSSFFLPDGADWPEALDLALYSADSEILSITRFSEYAFQTRPFLGVKEPFSDEISFYESSETTIELIDFTPILKTFYTSNRRENPVALIRLSLIPKNVEEVFIKLATEPVLIHYCVMNVSEQGLTAFNINIKDTETVLTFTQHTSERCEVLFKSSEATKLHDLDNNKRFVMNFENPFSEMVLPLPSPMVLEIEDGKYVTTLYVYL